MGEEVRQAIYGMVARCTVGIKFQKVAVFKMRLLHIFSSSFFCQTRRPNPTKKWLLERVKKKLVLILKFFFLKSPFAYWEKLTKNACTWALRPSLGFMGYWVHGLMGSWVHGLMGSWALGL
jgi:hypothetical protein